MSFVAFAVLRCASCDQDRVHANLPAACLHCGRIYSPLTDKGNRS